MGKPWKKNNFPRGKLNSTDEGELQMTIAHDNVKGVVAVEFGNPVKWFALYRDEALALAELIKNHAEKLHQA